MNKSLYGHDFGAPRLEAPRISVPGLIATRTAGRSAVASDAHSPAFAELFHAIDALRQDDRPIVLQFAGSDPAAATDRIASGFARIAHDATDSPILYLDATGRGSLAGPDLVHAFREGRDPADIALPTHERRISWATFGRTLALAGEEAGRLLEAVRSRFAITVLDCGTVAAGRAVQPLARHCDGTVLVTEADRTRTAAIGVARSAIERAGGRLLGAVMNGGGRQMPRWLEARF